MRRALTPHPDWPSAAVSGIAVEIARMAPDTLALTYVVSGRIADLVRPAPAAPARTDELWKSTCFEAFVRPEPGEAYFEFNFAPSSHWAAYAFDRYREGMTAPAEAGPPQIEVQSSATELQVRVRLALSGLPRLPAGAPWRLGLSAVIEEAGGRRSYWALTHPPGKADFHHADGFALALTA
jgi:hypothetical protein